MKTRLLVVLVLLAVGSFTLADDWPQFRGPDRSGVSKEKGLLQAWPKGGPALAWTFKDTGLGFSTVSIAKGVVYTLGTDMKFTDEYVIAIDEKAGTELWRVKIGPLYTYKGNAYGDGPRSTPTIDGNFLYALGGEGQLVCIDVTKKGAEVWRKHLVNDLGGDIMDKYGFSEGPLVDGKVVICTPGGAKGTLAALDKATGNVVWRSVGLKDKAPFSSAIVADLKGVRQYIQLSYHEEAGNTYGAVSGFDAATGKVLWTKTICSATDLGISTTPVVVGNQVYVTSGSGAGSCHLFEINAMQEATEKFNKKAFKKVKNTHGGVVAVGGHIYGHSERELWVCQDLKTGNLAWNEPAKCQSGSITAADGKLYLYSDEGQVSLIDASPKEFNLVGSFEIPMKSAARAARTTSRFAKTWAHPVVANGHLYLRDCEYIFAYKTTK